MKVVQNRIFPIWAILNHKQVDFMRRKKLLFIIFQYQFFVPEIFNCLNMQISFVMTSLTHGSCENFRCIHQYLQTKRWNTLGEKDMCFETLPSRKSGGFRTGFLLQNQSTYSKLNPGETEVWIPGSPLKKILMEVVSTDRRHWVLYTRPISRFFLWLIGCIL